MKKKIQETYNQVTAPEELKSSVLIKMKESEQTLKPVSKISKKSRFKPSWGYAGLAAAAAFFFLIAFRLWDGSTIYKTPLKNGEFLSVVELQDGYLQFLESDSVIPLTPNAGAIGKQETTENEWESQVVSMKGGGTITIKYLAGGHKKRVPNQLRSHFAEQELVLTVMDDERNSFEAEYEKDGILYCISAENVTQKQFIDFLIEQLHD